jgi:hypothetical protein
MIYFETNSDGSKSLGAINSGKNEGIGSVFQYQLLLYAICKKLNVQFYNSGFKNIGHSSYSDFSQEKWDDLFTRFFNLSSNKNIKNKLFFPNIDSELFSFIDEMKDNSNDFLIYLNPEDVLNYGQSLINEIYEKKYLVDLKNNFVFNKNYFHSSVLNVCLHIRSVNPEDVDFCISQDFRELYTKKNQNVYISLIKKIKQVCGGEKTHLHIHSQGNEDNFIDFLSMSDNSFKIITHLNDNPISDIYHMSHSDLLITSNSSFSWICHLLNYNPSLVRDNFWHSTYPNTIKLDEKYSFNQNRLIIK